MLRTAIKMAALGAVCAGVYSGHANAADLGRTCCGDLEERISELEATVARKGNRVVSLQISGHIVRELLFWDDGDQSDIYVVDPGTTLASNFKLTGEAQIKPGWSAGFNVHIEVLSAQSLFVDQLNDDAGEDGLSALHTNVFLKSDQLGKLTIGKQSQASDNAAILADFSGTLVQANWVLFNGASLFLRPKDSGLSGAAGLEENRIGSLGFCQSLGLGIGADCNGVPLDAIRYDSPTIAGFSASAAWGEDDFWDVAARYAGEFGAFRLKTETAYSWVGDRDDGVDAEYFQIGAMVMHTPTGLFLYGAYGREESDGAFIDVSSAGLVLQEVPDNDHWYLKGGIRKQWSELGHTVFYGEYARYNNMFGGFSCDGTIGTTAIGGACAGGTEITGSELNRWGMGVVQEIDAASMSIWAKYVQLDTELDFIDGGSQTQDYETLHQFALGMMISF
ncbi:MAG: porin [Rhodomicrobium sp.]|nr:porin [Rhodomicrobium sp.]